MLQHYPTIISSFEQLSLKGIVLNQDGTKRRSRFVWPSANLATLTVAFTQMQLKPLQTQLGIILPNRLEKVFEC